VHENEPQQCAWKITPSSNSDGIEVTVALELLPFSSTFFHTERWNCLGKNYVELMKTENLILQPIMLTPVEVGPIFLSLNFH